MSGQISTAAHDFRENRRAYLDAWNRTGQQLSCPLMCGANRMEKEENLMRIELTEQQRQALAQAGNEPLCLVDSTTNATYYLVRADLYAKVQSLFDGDFDPREAYPAVDTVFGKEWDDPQMVEYNNYEEHRS